MCKAEESRQVLEPSCPFQFFYSEKLSLNPMIVEKEDMNIPRHSVKGKWALNAVLGLALMWLTIKTEFT